MATVYVETTIPSFYFDARPEPAVVVRREMTRMWWPTACATYELVTSVAVLDERYLMPTDPVVDDVRAIRHQISAEHGHDPARLLAYLMEQQKAYADRMIKPPTQRGEPAGQRNPRKRRPAVT